MPPEIQVETLIRSKKILLKSQPNNILEKEIH